MMAERPTPLRTIIFVAIASLIVGASVLPMVWATSKALGLW
ncbi:hypothetical protein [Methylobacterium gnaphalii]|nr:hypothetical protein [Methylobacterium gnaphalii]GJD69709.1 hypothetical protein MMMDOFMJ_2646 [Methylobacterium gnaphalii]